MRRKKCWVCVIKGVTQELRDKRSLKRGSRLRRVIKEEELTVEEETKNKAKGIRMTKRGVYVCVKRGLGASLRPL